MSALNKDCDKAARIIKSFIDKGKIPAEVIANAKGLAIFSGFRAAAMMMGSGGSGVVVARLADGSWSAPSAFSVWTGGVGGVYGLEVYDCVCVLNTQEAVDAYSSGETSLGAGVAMTAGPIGGSLDLSTREVKPVWTYTKSRGLYGGFKVDGTVIKEKPGRNAEWYGSKISAAQILKGGANWPPKAQLHEVLKAAEGKSVDDKVIGAISTEPTPGDIAE